jgi:hypothetical protein
MTQPGFFRRRWPILAFLVCAAIALGIVFHAPLLRAVANQLVVDDPLPGAVDTAPLDNDADSLAIVARLYAEGRVRKVLLIPAKPRRTERLGITPSELESARSILKSLGVPADAIEPLADPADGLTERARVFRELVERDPQRTLNVVAPRYASRYARRFFGLGQSDAERSRLHVVSRPTTRFDERHWWTVRLAVQDIFQGYLRWFFDAVCDLPSRHHIPADLEHVDAALARGEKP